MNKKILVVSLLAVFTLVAISLVSAVSTNTVKPVERKDSPLFGIRTRLAIRDRLQELRENIKARFIGERLFFLPFQWLRNIRNKIHPLETGGGWGETCDHTYCWACTDFESCTDDVPGCTRQWQSVCYCKQDTMYETCDQWTCESTCDCRN